MKEPFSTAPRFAAAAGVPARARGGDPGRLSRQQLDELIGRLRQRRPEGPGAAAPAAVPALGRGRADGAVHPLSFAQQRLWFLSQLEPGSPAYTIAGALELAGALDATALGQSLDGLLARHEALRATFSLAAGVPVQAIGPAAPHRLPLVDLAALPEAARAAAGERVAAAAARRPFDLAAGPLLRALLLRSGPLSHLLVLAMHHAAADGRSLEIFFEDLASLYAANREGRPAALPQLPIRFVDFARWEREEMSGARLAGLLNYWRARLAGAPAALELPYDRPRPARLGPGGASLPLALPAAPLAALAALARRHRATPCMALLAALETLLCRHSGQEDLLVGTAVANRGHAETAGVVGCFVNTVALRADLSGAPSFAGLLERVRAAA
ncbi:MAG: hypothetical protein JOZ15_10645, partial [Acidobacteria bacterium]|nr:hypothetical protein [Acidobacteriota bacterium]